MKQPLHGEDYAHHTLGYMGFGVRRPTFGKRDDAETI